jgi:hypothetical protein
MALMSATHSWLTVLQHLQQLQRLAAQHEQHLAQQHHDMAQLDMEQGALKYVAVAQCVENAGVFHGRCPSDAECDLIVLKLTFNSRVSPK